ncbi:unnamed protein product, partial [Didymodactylos carnosus]
LAGSLLNALSHPDAMMTNNYDLFIDYCSKNENVYGYIAMILFRKSDYEQSWIYCTKSIEMFEK